MGYLPKGFGTEVAKAEATVTRQRLNDGDYVFQCVAMFEKQTQQGPAVIIEHEIVEAKAIKDGVEPSPVGTKWGYFLPRYGKAAVMLKPNLKAYTLGLFGLDEKRVSEAQLGELFDRIGGEEQALRGMLIRGRTFHTKKEDGEDFMGVNWSAYVGENMPDAPSVKKRRAELDAKGGTDVASLSKQESTSQGAPQAPASAPSAPPSAPAQPQSAGGPPPPPVATSITVDTLRAAGWKEHPSDSAWWMKGAGETYQAKKLADLLAGAGT